MKYIIPENRVKDIVEKYLDSIPWHIWESGEEEYPIEVFGHKGDNRPVFTVHCTTHRYGETCNLVISTSFQKDLESLFGKEIVSGGDDGEPNTLVMDWFNKRFEEFPVDDYLYATLKGKDDEVYY